jgi:hypothetical protein
MVVSMRASERHKLGLFNYFVIKHAIDEDGKQIDIYEIAWEGERNPKRYAVKEGKIILDEDDGTKNGKRESVLAKQAERGRIV